MRAILSKEQRDEIFGTLAIQQKEFIQQHVKRGKKTVFANIMAKDKGLALSEHVTNEELELLLDEWVLEDYIDNGFVNPETKCECGRPLRYQYIVRHKGTNKVRRFGISHFEEHTGISEAIVREITKGFYEIDYEMDDLLIKIHEDWNINMVIQNIPEGFALPNDIKAHIQADVPLLNRQIKRTNKQIVQFLDQKEFENRQIEDSNQLFTDQQEYQEDDQFSFNLFEAHVIDTHIEKEKSSSRSGYTKQYNFSLSQHYQNEILSYIKTGVSSTRVICELLIKNNNVDSERYTTDKPKIYVSVCMYLDSLVEEGILELGINDEVDRIYSLSNAAV